MLTARSVLIAELNEGQCLPHRSKLQMNGRRWFPSIRGVNHPPQYPPREQRPVPAGRQTDPVNHQYG